MIFLMRINSSHPSIHNNDASTYLLMFQVFVFFLRQNCFVLQRKSFGPTFFFYQVPNNTRNFSCHQNLQHSRKCSDLYLRFKEISATFCYLQKYPNILIFTKVSQIGRCLTKCTQNFLYVPVTFNTCFFFFVIHFFFSFVAQKEIKIILLHIENTGICKHHC